MSEDAVDAPGGVAKQVQATLDRDAPGLIEVAAGHKVRALA